MNDLLRLDLRQFTVEPGVAPPIAGFLPDR
jgi:hypothetical protein